jgi:hypothetical protein
MGYLYLLTIAYKICLSAQFSKSSCQVAKDKLFWDGTMGLKDRAGLFRHLNSLVEGGIHQSTSHALVTKNIASQHL